MFFMDGVNMVNKRITKKPLTINLSDGKQVMSTHMWHKYPGPTYSFDGTHHPLTNGGIPDRHSPAVQSGMYGRIRQQKLRRDIPWESYFNEGANPGYQFMDAITPTYRNAMDGVGLVTSQTQLWRY